MIDLDDPSELAIRCFGAFFRQRTDAALYGGLALAIYGEPRETRDADLVVDGVTGSAGRAVLVTLGLETTVAFENRVFGGLSVTRLAVNGGDKLNTIDLVATRSQRYTQRLLSRAVHAEIRTQRLSVVAAEDFVVLKTLSTRARDLEDARGVMQALPGRLDEVVMRAEIDQLATEITDHDIRGRFEQVMR